MESSEPSPTVKTRILILSDTHSLKPFDSSDTQHAFRSPLPKADLLLHAGDLTLSGKALEYQAQLEMLSEHPAELKIVIPGNHDITLDESYYATHQWKHPKPEDLVVIREMWTGNAAREAGIVLMEEGIQSFELRNGAKFTLYASAYTPEFCDYSFGYPRNEDRFNPPSAAQRLLGRGAANPVPSHPQVDIMLTHGPPFGILDQVVGANWRNNTSVGCEHLLRAVKRARPRLHAFGHIHEQNTNLLMTWKLSGRANIRDESTSIDVGTEDVMKARGTFLDISESGSRPLQWGQETLFVNAAIMDACYNPRNAPWIVDLDLPRA
jgi:Calcineurin-like phosphoesterase